MCNLGDSRAARASQRPFTPSTAVQIRLGTPNLNTTKNAKVQKILAFFIFSFPYGLPQFSCVCLHLNRVLNISVCRETVLYRLEIYIFPSIGKTHISQLETRDVMEVVKPLEQRGNHETSRRVLQIISQIFRYAVITGRAKYNVATVHPRAVKPRKTFHRAAVLEPKKVGQLLRVINAYEGYFPLVCALKLGPLFFMALSQHRIDIFFSILEFQKVSTMLRQQVHNAKQSSAFV